MGIAWFSSPSEKLNHKGRQSISIDAIDFLTGDFSFLHDLSEDTLQLWQTEMPHNNWKLRSRGHYRSLLLISAWNWCCLVYLSMAIEESAVASLLSVGKFSAQYDIRSDGNPPLWKNHFVVWSKLMRCSIPTKNVDFCLRSTVSGYWVKTPAVNLALKWSGGPCCGTSERLSKNLIDEGTG